MKTWKQIIGILAFIAILLTFSTCDFGNDNNNGNGTPTGVDPLTTTKWNQYTPFNDLFPMVNGQRSVTDCGNLALAKIMRFHKYPATGNGQSTSVRINSDSLTVPTVNFNIAYDWDNMLDIYTTANPGNEQQRNAVSTLVYHVAAAVGANMEAGSYPLNYLAAMTNIFGYDKSIRIHYRRYYTNAEWEAMLRQQLDAGLPVYYWGIREGGTHAFVVDGYDNNGRFHINWGWRGTDNGWYTLNNLNPPSTGHYNTGHLIIINIKPDAGGVSIGYEIALHTFTASKTTVSQNELFTVSSAFRNTGKESFSGGQVGVALVNNNGNIVSVIGNRDYPWSLDTGWLHNPITTNCTVPDTVAKGQYKLRIVTRSGGVEQWKIVSLSDVDNGVPNSIPFTVQ